MLALDRYTTFAYRFQNSTLIRAKNRTTVVGLDDPWIQTSDEHRRETIRLDGDGGGSGGGRYPTWTVTAMGESQTNYGRYTAWRVLQESALAENDAIHAGRANTGPLNRNTNRSAPALLGYLPSSNLIAICTRN